MTTFNEAVTTLLKGDSEEASKLFSQYVIEQANKIQRSLNEGLSLDDILSDLDDDDEDFGNLDAPLEESTEVNADPDEDPAAITASVDVIKESDASKFAEGRLDLTQEENGDLLVKHTTEDGEVEVAAPASLQEQFELELASALVKMRDGEFATGGSVEQNTITPVGDRSVAPSAIKTSGEEKVAMALQPAPEAVKVKAANSLETVGDALEPVPNEGDPKAALNAWKADTTAVTPVPKK